MSPDNRRLPGLTDEKRLCGLRVERFDHLRCKFTDFYDPCPVLDKAGYVLVEDIILVAGIDKRISGVVAGTAAKFDFIKDVFSFLQLFIERPETFFRFVR